MRVVPSRDQAFCFQAVIAHVCHLASELDPRLWKLEESRPASLGKPWEDLHTLSGADLRLQLQDKEVSVSSL